MSSVLTLKATAGYLWRLPLCAVAYVVGNMAGGALVSALGLPLPEVPEQANEQIMGLLLFVASLALAAALAPLARRMQGAYWVRWLALAALCYVCLGVNTPIEAAIFTNMGGMMTIPILSVCPCLLFGAVMALLFKPAKGGVSILDNARRFFGSRSAGQWAWRLAVAVCAFPVIYWTFGSMVAPFVLEYYRQGQFGLALPRGGVIIAVQLLRSTLFLVAALPILMAWSGSRLRLTWALGLAFYVLVGLFGLIQASWLAPTLLVLHNIEIFADSMVYALVLVLLLMPGDTARADERFTRLPPCIGRAQTPVGS